MYYDDDQLWSCDQCEALIPRQSERCPRCGHPVGARAPKIQCPYCGTWTAVDGSGRTQCSKCNRVVR